MTLKEAIRSLPDERYIKIGCKDGSGYIYDGRVKDLDMDELESKYETYERAEQLLRDARELLKKAHKKLDVTQNLLAEKRKEAIEQGKTAYTLTITHVRPYEQNMINGRRLITSAKNNIKEFLEWKPLRDREVVDIFRADPFAESINEPVTALIVPGSSCRVCWWVGDEGRS